MTFNETTGIFNNSISWVYGQNGILVLNPPEELWYQELFIVTGTGSLLVYPAPVYPSGMTDGCFQPRRPLIVWEEGG